MIVYIRNMSACAFSIGDESPSSFSVRARGIHFKAAPDAAQKIGGFRFAQRLIRRSKIEVPLALTAHIADAAAIDEHGRRDLD